MKITKRFYIFLPLCGSMLALVALSATTRRSSAASTPPQATAAQRDGSHDFDPLLGSWKYHLRRRLNPLTGSNTWVDLEGTGVCRKVYDGAQIDEFHGEGSTGIIEGLTLRVYNPTSHQWRLYWANQKAGVLDPPQIGEFKNGVGEFVAQDTQYTTDHRAILVRFHWTKLNTDTPHFEQSFSDDGGKTWEVNWITDQTRVPDANKPS